jgi:hypothetical protein
VHARAAQLLERGLLPDGHLDHPGRADVETGLAVHHDDEIGERGKIRRARRRGTEEDAHLRHHARELDLVVEDAPRVIAPGEDLDLLRDPPTGGVDQIDERDLQALGALRNADDLLDGFLAPRPRLHRVVVGHDADGAAAHRAHAGDDAVGGRVRLLVSGEQEVFLELGAGIEQEAETVADEELALVLQLVAVLEVALLDAGPLAEVALLGHRALSRDSDSPTG